ncbi:PREDICTED: protein SHOOT GRAVITROPISM 5-like [Nicotiana attenuata]|uniref:Protein shoot gravitropism 5 n=1 Tax=Nicotiana attenuata TaxID=49451 RepID=A0A1J6J0F1_NICAT|nr:PREDICTED: protein SHOOT GRAVITROPISM 5-like [Nicotiana attenuata]OIT03375.1 protein shoot gravitropism 5 [Nicotiana attenuata]
MLASHSFLFPAAPSHSEPFSSPENGFIIKRKRRPAGTPDPDAQVVYLTAEMLMESDRYVCEICNLSFQREQNLQMHRRRHKVPWKLKKKEEEKNEMEQVKKRVYVCPEPSCVHHDPSHALGDLVGIKKHFRRKHSNYKQWVCQKCSKGYAVQSDYKAHIKTCGTRGHSCDCGRVFSRVETFIEHQDSCKAQGTTTSKECDVQKPKPAQYFSNYSNSRMPKNITHPNLELELFTSSNYNQNTHNYSSFLENEQTPQLNLSFGGQSDSSNYYQVQHTEKAAALIIEDTTIQVSKLKSEAKEILKIAMEEKAMAAEKRQEAKCLIELANLEMAKAREIRQQLLAEYSTVQLLKDCAEMKIVGSQSHVKIITCNSCNSKQFQTVAKEAAVCREVYPALTKYLSSSIYRR